MDPHVDQLPLKLITCPGAGILACGESNAVGCCAGGGTVSIWISRRVHKLKIMEESKEIKTLNMNRKAIRSIL
jgi:hypothetical protein